MIVYFLRHASAGTKVANPKKDERRPLDEDGVLQSRSIGRFLSDMGVDVDAIVSSPLKRATQTASLAAEELGFEREIQLDPALRPESEFSAFQSMLARLTKYESVIIVGHNPSMTEFLSKSVGSGREGAHLELKKGAVAKVEMSGKSGTLHWLITAKITRTLQSSRKLSSRPKTSKK
jgi:phosphohistidine phosphatase